jgi:tRNA-Thr(GGU) m(6)t(6)A37 methyltransferase TsaA
VSDHEYLVQPIGWVESPLTDRSTAPKQGDEGAPAARIMIDSRFRDAARDLRQGDDVLVLTWLHLADRATLAVRPRGDQTRPITGVFSTRSPDRPNPIGLHSVRIESVAEGSITVCNLEAVHGTPVLDIKPVLRDPRER